MIPSDSGQGGSMEFAEVAVDAPLSLEKTLTYCIPNHMSVRCGHLV